MRPYNGKNRIGEYLQEHKLKKRWHKITLLLAVLVTIATTVVMILPAITMEWGRYTLLSVKSTYPCR